jgi:hypothetical protein
VFVHIPSQKFKLLEAAHLFHHLTTKLRKSVFVLIAIPGCHDDQRDGGYPVLARLHKGKEVHITVLFSYSFSRERPPNDEMVQFFPSTL